MSSDTTITQKPVVAHALRANQRFTTRLGVQFSAAVTYFSVLSLVPILMFAFSITGFVLTVLRPELLTTVQQFITDNLGGSGAGEQIGGLVEELLSNWRGVGIVGLLSSIYTGAGWAGNLKSAIRAQWRPDFNEPEQKRFIVVEVLVNLAIMLGLLVMIVLTFALSSVAMALSQTIIGWLGWQNVPGIGFFIRMVPILGSLAAGWLLFVYLYKVMPQHDVPFGDIARGALIGSVGLALLQYLTSFLMGKFASNPAAAVFGPVIALMLFFNLFAQLSLRVAAWIATSVQPVNAAEVVDIDRPLVEREESDVEAWQFDDDAVRTPGEPENPDSALAAYRRQALQVGPEEWVVPPEPDPDVTVNQVVAARAVKVSSATGYAVGAATGIGIGALIAGLIAKVTGRRQ